MGSDRISNSMGTFSSFDSAKNGHLLVATERQQNSRFEKSVVLLMQHDIKGSFGVALNKPAGEEVLTAWEKLTGAEAGGGQVVSGGPLKGPVFAIHQMAGLGDAEMPGGLYVSAQIDKLQQLMKQWDNPYRIVIGMAGWQEGQLAQELESGYWYTLPLDAETVFDDPEWMWESCLEECGRQHISDLVGEDLIPDDPSLN